ncbi:MAG: MFS transporter [Pseudomonadota bacterium]
MPPTPADGRRTVRLVMWFCLVQTLAQLGGFTFAALLPVFMSEWSLTHGEAGWLSGIFFGAYAVSVPVLVTLTDRIPARRVYLFAVALTLVSHVGMALLATGFWSALLLRILAGLGWAGTYMVGLRALTDEVTGTSQSRAVAANAASIGVAGALSFVIAGQMEHWFDWQGAFAMAALCSAAAWALALRLFPRRAPPAASAGSLFDFRPVFRNRNALSFSLAYCLHTWEMFVLRSWVVAYLTFALAYDGRSFSWLVPTVVAMLMELVGTVASVAGNEVAGRVGRRRWIVGVMCASMLCACMLGFVSAWGYSAVIALCVVYNALIYADSSALTAGTVAAAEPDRKGATMAVHALLGYGGGFLGPLTMGLVLHALGGESVRNWGIGFAHVAVLMLLGPVIVTATWAKPMPQLRTLSPPSACSTNPIVNGPRKPPP